jgi:hypothetical protein
LSVFDVSGWVVDGGILLDVIEKVVEWFLDLVRLCEEQSAVCIGHYCIGISVPYDQLFGSNDLRSGDSCGFVPTLSVSQRPELPVLSTPDEGTRHPIS